ncbi:molybdopterin-dependent oxidoreductase [Serratia bockelmannii]|uniref:Molybdopterin-dependent oxidoreductase n=1 Tax=Serratia bockelmannii TaxID=2703793 RepID=A0ABT8LXA7_9GAMM|nr:molybdopterin-dependent oxidoreductase [Serratia bockelmannii]MDN6881932.1 molybdopterin-dependent oxidoreductase [Serratia bockelmannii]HBH6890283.1 molybdopterin-dependent oxidoreductase [Serratia marcescens]
MKKFSSISVFIALVIASTASASVERQIGDLRVTDGKTNKTIVLTKDTIAKLPTTTITTSTAWTGRDKFTGISFKDVLIKAGVKGKTVRVQALNDYWVDIPMTDIENYNIILANKRNDVELRVRNFGPYFVIYPLDEHYEELNKPIFYSRFVWQVEHLTVDPK